MVCVSRRSLFLLLVLLALPTVDSRAQSFVPTGNMMMPRLGHSATLLQDGRVLVAGGNSAAEIYDPATGTFSATGAMAAVRAFHQAVLLQDGRVLLVGGNGCDLNNCLPSAELYDPATGTFAGAGHMSVAQGVYSAILLKNGKALVSGSNTIEVFDPATGAFTRVDNLPYSNFAPYVLTSTLLPDGEVMLASYRGGLLLYDPATDGFRQLPIPWQTNGATATPLLNGSVFLAGGYVDGSLDAGSFLTYVYDPATQTLRTTAQMPVPRGSHTATLLRDGRVLIAGGFNGTGSDPFLGIWAEAELYDPTTGKLSSTSGMVRKRYWHTATLLRDGRVLITGGSDDDFGGRANSSAELFIPESTQGSVPQVQLNSTRYCAGDTWTLMANSIAPLTSVQISGIRDGIPWTIPDWQISGPDGTLVATGTYGADAVGHYTLWLYAGGKTSSSISVTIENCSVHLDLTNSKSGNPQTDFYIGDSWTAHVTGSMPGANVKLLGISNGTPWTIESWGRTGSDGSFTATGTFPPGSNGNHAERVIVGTAQSNEVRFRVDY
jgi:hypothetical protein